jgi:hypothetical protein
MSEPHRDGQQGAAVVLYLDALGTSVTSLTELEGALRPRLEVSSERYAHFIGLDDETLANAAVTTQRAVDYLQRILLSLRDEVPRIDAVLAEIPRSFFTEDHAWRVLFDELRGIAGSYHEFKLLALARYRGYLVGCLNALNRISDERLQSSLGGELRAASENTTEYDLPRQHGGYDSACSRAEVIVRDLVRLPTGVTLGLDGSSEGAMDLWMARRRFRIECWSGPILVDERGRRMPLAEGRNLVGRGLYNGVVVDADFREVSRRHLILDVDNGTPVTVTDLSTLGSFMSRSRLRIPA